MPSTDLRFLIQNCATALLLAAGDRGAGASRDRALGWQELVSDLEVLEVPGTHFTVFDEPHIETVAKVVQDALSRRR